MCLLVSDEERERERRNSYLRDAEEYFWRIEEVQSTMVVEVDEKILTCIEISTGSTLMTMTLLTIFLLRSKDSCRYIPN